MPDTDMQLIQHIAVQLRYRFLPQLAGLACQISTLRSVESDVRVCLFDEIPTIGVLIDLDPAWIKQIVNKYGVLDLTFSVPADWLEEDYETGIDLLDALGFIMDRDEAEQFDYVASLVGDNLEDPTLLGELKADLEEGQIVLRILLKADQAEIAFPQVFTVIDACMTNAPSVWLHKYPYY